MGITIRTPGDSPSVRHRSRHMTGRPPHPTVTAGVMLPARSGPPIVVPA